MLDMIRKPGENPLITYLLTYCLTSALWRCHHDTSGKTQGNDAKKSRRGLDVHSESRQHRLCRKSENSSLFGTACPHGVGCVQNVGELKFSLHTECLLSVINLYLNEYDPTCLEQHRFTFLVISKSTCPPRKTLSIFCCFHKI